MPITGVIAVLPATCEVGLATDRSVATCCSFHPL